MKGLIQERLSDILWHATGLDAADLILKGDRFKLSGSITTDKNRPIWDQPDLVRGKGWQNLTSDRKEFYFSGGKLFFGSFARSPQSKYTAFLETGEYPGVLFKIDGRKLGQRWKGGPINYFPNGGGTFGGTQGSKFQQEWDEMEDRVISDKPFIEGFSKYILEVRVAAGWNEKYKILGNKDRIKSIWSVCKKRGIPIGVWNKDERGSFITGRGKGKIDEKDLIRSFKEVQKGPDDGSSWQDRIKVVKQEERVLLGTWITFVEGKAGVDKLKSLLRNREIQALVGVGGLGMEIEREEFLVKIEALIKVIGRERWLTRLKKIIRDKWGGNVKRWREDMLKKLRG